MREVQPPRHSRHELAETGITSPTGNKRPPSFEPFLFGTLWGSGFLIPYFPHRLCSFFRRLAVLVSSAVQCRHDRHADTHHNERSKKRSIDAGRQHIFGVVTHSLLEGP